MSAAPDGATASSAISPPVADATTPQGVNSPAGEEVSTATTPFPAGQHHPQRGSTRQRRGGEAASEGSCGGQLDLLLCSENFP